MSGGSFNYAYYGVTSFVGELGDKIERADEVNEWGEKPYAYSPEVIAKLKEIQSACTFAAALMKEAEWLYSGDTCEESFLERVTQIAEESK